MRPSIAILLVVLASSPFVRADQPQTFNGRTVEGWRQILQDGRSFRWERTLAVMSLKSFGPEALPAVPELIAEVRRGELRDGAVDALVEIGAGTEVSIPNLIEGFVKQGSGHLTGTGSFGVSGRERDGLVRIGGPAVPALRELLKGPDRGMRVCAADALGEMGPTAREAVPDLVRTIEQPAEDHLAQCLRHHAVVAVGRIGPDARAAAPVLLRRLEDKPSDDNDEAVIALCRIGVPPVRKLLDRVIRDGDWEASLILNWIGPKARDAAPELRRILDDPRKRVRIAAALALTTVEPAAPGLIRVLVDALEHPDEFWAVSDVVKALGQLGPRAEEAVPNLIALLDRGGDSDDALGVAEALVEIDPEGKRCVPALARALKHDNPDIAAEAALCLGFFGPAATHAVPMLETTVTRTGAISAGDADPRVCSTRALRRIGPDARPAIPALIDALNNLRNVARSLPDDDTDRYRAVEAVAETLGAFGPAAKAAIPALIDAAGTREKEDASHFLRQAAILALGRIGPDARAVLPKLRALMTEDGKDSLYQPELVITLLRLDPDGPGAEMASRWLAKPGSPKARAKVLVAMGRCSVEADFLTRRDLKYMERMLRDLDLGDEPSVEILEDWFDDLRRMGPGARLAIPRLTEYRSHPSPWVRLLAVEALEEIAPKKVGAGGGGRH